MPEEHMFLHTSSITDVDPVICYDCDVSGSQKHHSSCHPVVDVMPLLTTLRAHVVPIDSVIDMRCVQSTCKLWSRVFIGLDPAADVVMPLLTMLLKCYASRCEFEFNLLACQHNTKRNTQA